MSDTFLERKKKKKEEEEGEMKRESVKQRKATPAKFNQPKQKHGSALARHRFTARENRVVNRAKRWSIPF